MARKRYRPRRRKSLGSPALTKWKNKYEGALKASRRAREKAGDTSRTIVRTGTVTGTAYLAGMAESYFGEIDVFGVPGEVLAGAGLHVAAFMGVGGKNASDATRNIGDGFLAAWAVKAGRDMGDRMRGGAAEADSLVQGGSHYSLAGGGDSLNAQDIATLSRDFAA